MAEAAIKNAPPSGVIAVSHRDLPLYCPREEDKLWSQHPRVFLPIDKTGACTCPYCGARYQLRD